MVSDMNVLGLFDGIGAGCVALSRAGIITENYYRAEIDKYANQVYESHYPNDINFGDVNNWRGWDLDWSTIDLLIGGSPCQGFSFAGKQLAFDDPRSKLFFVYVDILNHIKSLNPDVKFLLENVKMKKEHLDVISEHLDVQPILINSALVSAQNRQRYYWCNWVVEQPQDKGLVISNIIDHSIDYDRPCHIIKNDDKGHVAETIDIKGMDCIKRVYGINGKSPTLNSMGGGNREPKILKNQTASKSGKSYALTHSYGGAVAWNSAERKQRTMVTVCESEQTDNPNVYDGVLYRKLTPLECERLQTFPDNYTSCVSNTQRYKALGNSWTVDVIAHIFGAMK